MKKCLICDNDIPDTKNKNAIYCSVRCCNKSSRIKFEKSHPERILANRIKQNSNAERRMLARIKSRAKLSNIPIPFDLDVSDISIPQLCPILGIEIVRYHGGNKPAGFHPNSASLDRIDPSKGYVKGNVRVISARANLLKNDATIAELKAVLKDLIELKK